MRFILFLIVLLFITRNSESKPQNVETATSAKTDSIQGCGYRKPDLGQTNNKPEEFEKESQYGEFPWMIGIYTTDTSTDAPNLLYCGGSLIHPSVILTGAVCLKNRTLTSLFVRAGDWDISKTDEPYPYQERKISEVIIHEHFERSKTKGNKYYINNIGLIVVDKPFEINENVNTICLPPTNQNIDGTCVASGWGSIFDIHKRDILKKIDLPIIARETCETRFKELGVLKDLHESYICAGGETGKDTCGADGGSPLVCPISGSQGRYYQGGIVAWGYHCNLGYPGGYSNVPYSRNWIDEKFTAKNLEKSYYNP